MSFEPQNMNVKTDEVEGIVLDANLKPEKCKIIRTNKETSVL